MQIQGGETFTDILPGKTLTSTRMNNLVNGAQLLNGAVLDQSEKASAVAGDTLLLGDSAVSADAAPKKIRVENLLLESQRNGASQYQATDTGSTNAYAIALSPAATAYTAGMVVRFKAGNANTGASTINVNGLGVKTIKTRARADLVANDILAGQIVVLVYDDTYFQCITALSAGEVTAAHVAESLRGGVNQYSADTGAADVYVATLVPAATAYTAGMVVRFKAAYANTGAATLNVNSLGIKDLKCMINGALANPSANEIQTGMLVTAVYDGTYFQIQRRRTEWDYTGTAAASIASGVTDFTHSLGDTPTRVRVVLLCSTAQSPWAVNDELDIANVAQSGGDIEISTWVDATNGKIRVAIKANNELQAVSASGTRTTLTSTSWKLKVYASL